MKEASFNTDVVRSCRELGFFAHKLADMPRMPGVTRFIGEKPVDVIAGVWGRFVGLESKQLKKFARIGIKLFRPNQVVSLNEIVATKNEAWALVNLRLAPDPARGVKRTNLMLAFPWDTWGHAFQNGVGIGAKELREVYFHRGWHNGFFICEGHKGLYPVEFLFHARPTNPALSALPGGDCPLNPEDDGA
jgi:hypothetical protein